MEPPRPGGRGSDRFGRRCYLGRLCCSHLRHSTSATATGLFTHDDVCSHMTAAVVAAACG